MNLKINFLKNLFKKKKKVEVIEPGEKINDSSLYVCDFEFCKKPILPNAPSKSFGGKRYHMRCWRKIRKNSKKIQKYGKL